MTDTATTYTEFIQQDLRDFPSGSLPGTKGECRSPEGALCTLCLASRLRYHEELPLKQCTLDRFRDRILPHIQIDPLIPSSLPRAYRSVTKRKVFRRRGAPLLGLIDPDEVANGGGFPVIRCLIEPEDHGKIFASVQKWLDRHPRGAVGQGLRYVVLKGTPPNVLMVLSLFDTTGGATREANNLSRWVSRDCCSLKGVFLYRDSSRGRYYLGGDARHGTGSIRKLWGASAIVLKNEGKTFLFPPTVFTQINTAMVGRLVSSVRELLRLRSDEHLFDLYCGYGLFSLSLAGGVRRVTGAEISRDAIDAAVANAHRQNVTNVRFMRMDVTARAVGSLLTDARHGDVVVLDPPRGGTSPGVIEAIAARRPRRVVHIVCAIDLVAPELERWITSGYRCSRAVPLDLFPGTSSLETLLCLEPIEPGA